MMNRREWRMLGVGGRFDPETADAVEEFRNGHGLDYWFEGQVQHEVIPPKPCGCKFGRTINHGSGRGKECTRCGYVWGRLRRNVPIDQLPPEEQRLRTLINKRSSLRQKASYEFGWGHVHWSVEGQPLRFTPIGDELFRRKLIKHFSWRWPSR